MLFWVDFKLSGNIDSKHFKTQYEVSSNLVLEVAYGDGNFSIQWEK